MLCINPPHPPQPHPTTTTTQKLRVWTKLELPKSLGGGGGKPTEVKPFRGIAYITYKVDIEGDRLLADVTFTRDRLGRWHASVQRAPLQTPRTKPVGLRKVAFVDSGLYNFDPILQSCPDLS